MAKLTTQGGTNSLIWIIASTLIALLLYNSILNPISQTSLFEVEAQPVDTKLLKGSIVLIQDNVQNMEKKLQDVDGEIIPNHYILVLKDNTLLPPAKAKSLVAG
jgi:hypothetical protein